MPELAFPPNSDLLKGFTVPQVGQKHGWPEPMVWSLALKGMDDRPGTRPEIEPYHWDLNGRILTEKNIFIRNGKHL